MQLRASTRPTLKCRGQSKGTTTTTISIEEGLKATLTPITPITTTARYRFEARKKKYAPPQRYWDCHKTILLALLHLSVDSIIK